MYGVAADSYMKVRSGVYLFQQNIITPTSLGCSIWVGDEIDEPVTKGNECFDIYIIQDICQSKGNLSVG